MAIYSKSMRTPIYRQMYAKIHIHIFTPERKMTDGCDIEMFYLELNDKTMCSGCRACEQICPMGSITMDIDGEGFAYPIKERESCNNCNLCRRVCPCINNEFLFNHGDEFTPKAYMAVHKDESVLMNSASGGAFTAIAYSFCEGDFAVFGVELNKEFKAVHSFVETLAGIGKYRKSKYIQSDIGDSFARAKRFLNAGKRVLFTGTPCQIAGLRLFLGRTYENLLCVDLVCRGVPSQAVFDKYLEHIEAKYNGELSSYSFRTKRKVLWNWNSRNATLCINNTPYVVSSDNDPYLRGFYRALYYRPICYECQFATEQRVSDITLADFWGIEMLYSRENVHKGVSAIMTNTPRGESLVNKLNEHMRVIEVERRFIVESNQQLMTPPKMHPKRQIFFDNFRTTDFGDLMDRCIPKRPVTRRIASRILSERTKLLVRRLLKGG
jgi:ferredoxin